MLGFCKLDLRHGITFTALEPRDADAFGRALRQQDVPFTRETTEVDVRMTDGSAGLASAERLTIDPKAGSAFVLDIFQSMSRGQY